jgi:hypothetical protein
VQRGGHIRRFEINRPDIIRIIGHMDRYAIEHRTYLNDDVRHW